MRAVLEGQDTLVVMPTGAGKSAVYQVPAVLLDGATVVVSPLISLQRDQVAGLASRDAPAAVAVNSAQPARLNDAAFEDARRGRAEYIFLAPEQLAKDDVIRALATANVSLFVVDEAHCVSAWGPGFRPDYLTIGAAVRRLGHPTVLALTATATPPVREDIIEHLGMRHARQVVAGFDRPNLRLCVDRYVGEADKRSGVLESVVSQQPPGIVYTATRRDTHGYAGELSAAGLRVAAYHAGMNAGQRHGAHDAFLAGDLDVIVATNAFGMGIDKPDVRFVLHASVTDSLDSYYQEIGRAGRDAEPAQAILCYRPEDFGLRRYLVAGLPDQQALAKVATEIRHHGPTTPRDLAELLNVSRTKLSRLINLLEQTGALTRARRAVRYLDGGPTPDEAAQHAMAIASRRRKLDQSRIEMMRGYAETPTCRRQFLLGYFGEPLPEPCDNCDTCRTGLAYEHARPETETTTTYRVNRRVDHAEWGRGTVMRTETDRITVLFDDVGYKTLSLPAVEQSDLLRLDH
jgi:ATP-dependent DNA helicase RecQ